ncbi:FAD-binding domain-containing protein [Polyplosphaeria fusca]|uniref:FAD-binding domain-containing protein n=1 Tax=Polyplosphaeria fusca TaxID=682080 RepID=A0A9P4QID7_9PLEO|nr:FAD-binding domain-containing protein [Polyplosphaeria fusca]
MVNASCCAQLAKIFGPQVLYPLSDAYLAAQQSYWSIQESRIGPACFFAPQSAPDVAQAVSILVGTEHCEFAIRGQSHAPAEGFANIQNGVTIDMRALNSVALDAGRTKASVGAGASWQDIYTYLDAYNVSVAGGRNGAVGVGGLLLGGGISYFAPRVGWACDNVVNFEIALASGQLINANATFNQDLFKALKGGGNNFGIVTRFDLATFNQGPILAGPISSPFSEREAVFKAFSDLADARNYDQYASLVLGLTWKPSSYWQDITTTAIHTKPDADPTVYKDFLAVPGTTQSLKTTKLSTFSNETATPPLSWQFHTATYSVSASLLSRIVDACNSTITTNPIPGFVLWQLAFEPLPTIITQFGAKTGGNVLGTTPADRNAIVLLLTAVWENYSASDATVKQAGDTMIRRANEIAREMGLLHGFRYMNYANPDQDPIASYGEDNVRYLSAVSRRYDPEGVFQSQVPGGFKLPKYV